MYCRSIIIDLQSRGKETPQAGKTIKIVIERFIKYQGFIVSAEVKELPRQHHAARLGGARAVRDTSHSRAHKLSVLTFGRRLWTWTLFVRSLIEDVAAAPQIPSWAILAAERTQLQLLAALLSDAMVDVPTLSALAPLLVVCRP